MKKINELKQNFLKSVYKSIKADRDFTNWCEKYGDVWLEQLDESLGNTIRYDFEIRSHHTKTGNPILIDVEQYATEYYNKDLQPISIETRHDLIKALEAAQTMAEIFSSKSTNISELSENTMRMIEVAANKEIFRNLKEKLEDSLNSD